MVKMRSVKVAVRACALALLLVVLLLSVAWGSEGGGGALVAPLTGTVGVQMEEFVQQAVRRAAQEGRDVLVFQLDTPGGLVESMRGIVQSILASPVPVVVWVPGGGRAASAGAFIVQAAHVADRFLLALLLSLVMWGGLYQGYNAVVPAFFPEQFPSRVRVTGMAIGQNIGTALSSLAAMGFAALCPPGTSPTAIVLMIGSLTLATTLLVAAAAHLSPETHRVSASGLGDPAAAPLPEEEYLRLRASTASPGIFTSIRSPRPTTAPPRKEHP